MKLPVVLRLVLRLAPRGELREAMLGDLQQEFALRRREHGDAAARRWASLQALRSLGPCLRMRLEGVGRMRTIDGGRWTRNWKHAARAMTGRPLYAFVLVLTFALGIGLNTSILATASQLVMAPLPYPRADRLVVPWPGRALPAGLLAGLLEDSPTFDAVALFWDRDSAVYYDPSDPDAPSVGYDVAVVSRAYLDLLGLDPAVGRTFRDEDVPPEELRAGIGKVVLTHHAWVDLFGADPTVVGAAVSNGPFTTEIIGVMPPEATPMARGLDGWSVVGFESDLTSIPRASFEALGRLAPGVSIDEARAELEVRLARADSAAGRETVLPMWSVPASFGPVSTPVEEQTLVDLRTYLSGNARGGLGLLVAAGLATLLVALVNASALALNRSLDRRREARLRRMLGARRRDLLGLLLAEQTLLASAGGVAALAVAWLGGGALATVLPAELPHALVDRIGRHALLWTAASSFVCALASTAVAAVPLLADARHDVANGGAAAGGRTVTAARRSLHGLLALQVTVVTVLMVGAGLLLRTVGHLRSVEPGFAWDRTAVVHVQAAALWRQSPDALRDEILADYFERAVAELEALARVRAAGQGVPPLATTVNSLWEITEGARSPEPGRPDIEAGWRMTGAGDYFAALDVPLLRGRSLEPEDAPEGEVPLPTTAVVNQLFARRLWPGQEAVGRTFHLALGAMPPRTLRVVGVVGTYRAVALDQPPIPLFFTRSPPGRSATTPILVRLEGPPDPFLTRVEEVVRAVDPRVPFLSVAPLSDTVRASVGGPQSALALLGGLAAVGMVLGLLGVYGVTALNTARRTRELGIRMALGARAGAVARLVVGQGLLVVAGGVAVGLLVAACLVPVLREMLFQVSPRDPVTFTAVPAVLLVTAGLAALPPALRAGRLDPSETLRTE